ncbi:MAG TPA: ABC transporter ATP-binding protein [Acidimicrobiales bacterium]|nr:ABC transporter ATP-binding protein [Acidimicrobiales bacterium]
MINTGGVTIDGRPATRRLLGCTGVSCHYGGVAAVREVDLYINQGTCLGLIGPNGAGKSTLLNAIAGSGSLSEGQIEFDGHAITGLPPYEIARLGAIRTFQSSSEFPHLSVMENMLAAERYSSEKHTFEAVFLPRSWKGKEQKSLRRAREYLARFGLSHMEDEYAGSLSGGQRRLLELARALMAEPIMLLLDEPTAGVAGPTVEILVTHLKELSKEGMTILLVEHNLQVVEDLCDSIAVMALGEVIAQGTLDEVRRNEAVVSAYLS